MIPNPEYIRQIIDIVNNKSHYGSLISIKMTDMSVGSARVEVDIESKHIQQSGVVDGGLIAALIDTVTFWAMFLSVRDPHAGLISVDLKLNYLAAATGGKLVATGREIKMGRTLGYADAEVRDQDGKLIAHGASTCIVLPDQPIVSETPLAPKFLD
ncbi:MAG: PaaI family thioesterase [Gammaproteobacteria bacterium]